MPSTPLPAAGDDVAEPVAPAFASARRFDWGNDRAPTFEPPPPPSPLSPVAVGALPTGAPAASSDPSPPASLRTPHARVRAQSTWWWIAVLGGAGFAAGAIAAALFASDMGYDWRRSMQIGALAGLAGGAVGAMIPPVARAIGWALIAAGSAAVGGGALWLLSRVAPAFVERILDLMR